MPIQKFQFQVVKKRQLTPSVFELVLEPNAPFEFVAGQFINISIPTGSNGSARLEKRSYSIASSPEATAVELCIQKIEGGLASEYLSKLAEGDSLECAGPLGKLTYPAEKKHRHFCLVATGTGIAPYRSIILSDGFKQNSPQSVRCLLGVRTEDELLYGEQLGKVLGRENWIPCVTRPSANWKGYKGRVTDYLRQATDIDWNDSEFYLCGNGAMIREVREILARIGVPREAVHLEAYFQPKSDRKPGE